MDAENLDNIQSPIMALLHELDHANENLTLYQNSTDPNKTPRSMWVNNSNRLKYSDTDLRDAWENPEERRVIQVTEPKVINELLGVPNINKAGLVPMTNHRGQPTPVKDQFSIK